VSDKPIRLPRKMGATVNLEEHRRVAQLTAHETAELEKLGLEPTTRIKGSLDVLVQQILDEDTKRASLESPVPPGTPPIQFDPATATPVDRLNKEQRDRLAEQIREMNKLDTTIKRSAASIATQVPGITEALLAAETPTISTKTEEPGINVNRPTGASGVAGVPKFCPRCGLEVAKLDLLEVDRTDKLAWVASLYGARFKKSYYMPGIGARIVFRGLTSNETSLIYKQAKLDMDRNVWDAAEFLTQLIQYRLALQLESISFESGVVLTSPIKDVAKDDGIKEMHDHVYTHVLVNESLARVVHKKYEEFQRLVEWMENSVEKEDFMQEISGQS